MDKNQISRGAHAGALSTRNHQSSWARFFILALLLGLGLTNWQPVTSAQNPDQTLSKGAPGLTSSQSYDPPSCHECERAFVECLAGGGMGCYAQYNACIENCD
jgi:hypothetical protein